MHAAAQKAKKQMVDFFNYTDNPRFYVVVDCIIFGYSEDKLKILVRQFDTDSGQKTYRLHGGFVQENEDLDDVATRIIRERTGVEEEYTDQVGTWGKQKRDPKARVISVAYYTLLNIAECDAEKIARYNSFWVDVDTLPELQLDHADMVQIALFQLRMFVGRKPIGFHLLPDMFTLTQLQRMHEAVLGVKLDKRNFRRRVAEMSFIVKSDQIDKLHSKRGAALYQYDEQMYKFFNKFKL